MSKPLIIDNWQKGVAQSPLLGHSRIVNCDIASSPGGLKINRKTTKKTSTTVDAQPNWIARDPDTPNNIFALDSNGVLYKSDDNGATWTEDTVRGGAGQGLIVAWGYVFVFCTTTIDVMKISDSSWTNDWATIGTDDAWHPAYMSKNDGKIYFGCGRYVGSIEQVGTFVPATAGTYVITLGTSASNSLDLPANYRIKCIEELGNNLMFGCWQGTSTFHFRDATIFPWDASSPSYSEPIRIEENGVHAMKVISNTLYILAGTLGAVYASNGYSVQKIAQIPESMASVSTDTSGGQIDYYPGSIMAQKNKLFFGIGNSVSVVGVYSLDIVTGVLQVENLISTGNDGTSASLVISSLLGVSYLDYLIGWTDGTAEGIDLTSGKYTSYGAYVESQLFIVGTQRNKASIKYVEWCMSKPLATGQGIRLKYRKGTSGTWTTIKEYAYSDTETATLKTVGAVSSYEDVISIDDLTVVQFRIEITTPGTDDTTPELIYVKFN